MLKKESPMPYDERIREYSGRKDSYEVEKELQVRKLLEIRTGIEFEFARNDEKKDVDIVSYRYRIKPDEWTKDLCGYIEVEEKCSWIGEEVPRKRPGKKGGWYCYSFLARKVFKFDWQNNKWTNELIDTAGNTVYLMVSRDLKGMFCLPVYKIPELGKGKTGKKGLSLYNDTYIDVPIDCKEVITGVDNCLHFIKQFLKSSFIQSDNEQAA